MFILSCGQSALASNMKLINLRNIPYYHLHINVHLSQDQGNGEKSMKKKYKLVLRKFVVMCI